MLGILEPGLKLADVGVVFLSVMSANSFLITKPAEKAG